MSQQNITDAKVNEDDWLPIDEYPYDKTPLIQRWHKIYNCPVCVRHRHAFVKRGCDWVTATLDNTWPEEAFEPFFKPLPKPPLNIIKTLLIILAICTVSCSENTHKKYVESCIGLTGYKKDSCLMQGSGSIFKWRGDTLYSSIDHKYWYVFYKR